MCALRAVDRLGLLGEGNLLAALAARPRLRWLADEEGARWAVLAQLGRIGDPGAFEEAVEWALQNRPRPEEAAAYVRRLRSLPPARHPPARCPPARSLRVARAADGAERPAPSWVNGWGEGATMLGPFLPTPPPDDAREVRSCPMYLD